MQLGIVYSVVLSQAFSIISHLKKKKNPEKKVFITFLLETDKRQVIIEFLMSSLW